MNRHTSLIPKLLWTLLAEKLGERFFEDEDLVKNIRRISRQFTEERAELQQDYLSDQKSADAYLAYFAPLNYAKISMLLDAHPNWVSSRKDQPFNILDFGCGPATATLATLYKISTQKLFRENKPSEIVVYLYDVQPKILEQAKNLVGEFAFKLSVRVNIKTLTEKELLGLEPKSIDLLLAANVMNELQHTGDSSVREPLLKLYDLCRGSVLILEPGHRVSSQKLIRFRDRLIKDSTKGTESEIEILGPCTHQAKCPLYRTPNWCHFSELHHDGRLEDLSQRVFKDDRRWLKFSYLMFKKTELHKPEWDHESFRAIGDLHLISQPIKACAIDLCGPDKKVVYKLNRSQFLPMKNKVMRGALVEIDAKGKLKSHTRSLKD